MSDTGSVFLCVAVAAAGCRGWRRDCNPRHDRVTWTAPGGRIPVIRQSIKSGSVDRVWCAADIDGVYVICSDEVSALTFALDSYSARAERDRLAGVVAEMDGAEVSDD